MKKLSIAFLLVAFVSVAFAFPPTFCNGCKPILSDKGVMSKNTLKNKACKSDSDFGMGCFSGEVELTGAIVSAYNHEYEVNDFEVRFYPDTNLDLPFLFMSYCSKISYREQGAVFDEATQKWDCSNVKIKFERLNFGVNLTIDTKKVFLPKEITDKHLGENGIRAKVRLKDYRFYGEGDAGGDALATLVEFSPLGEIYKHDKDNGEFAKLKYKSKDSFINLRDKPNGNIIAQIQESDMRYGDKKGQILATFSKYISKYMCFDEWALDEWIEVFYLPPNATKPQEAIYGYIHKSQIGFHQCD